MNKTKYNIGDIICATDGRFFNEVIVGVGSDFNNYRSLRETFYLVRVDSIIKDRFILTSDQNKHAWEYSKINREALCVGKSYYWCKEDECCSQLELIVLEMQKEITQGKLYGVSQLAYAC